MIETVDFEDFESGKLTPTQTKRVKQKLIEKFPRVQIYAKHSTNEILFRVGEKKITIDTVKLARAIAKVNKIKFCAASVSQEIRGSYMNKGFYEKLKTLL